MSRAARRRTIQTSRAQARTADQARERIRAAATDRARMRDQHSRTRRHGGNAA